MFRDPDAGAQFTYVEEDGSTSYCGRMSCWLDGHERERLSHRVDRMIQKRNRKVEDGQRKKKRKTRHGGQMVEVCGPGANLPVEIKTDVSFVAFHMLF